MSPLLDAPSTPDSYSYSGDSYQPVRPANTMSNNSSNRPLVPGIYVPTVAFFDPSSDDVDVVTVGKHAVRLAKAGVAGITTQGSNGEAVHLSHEERDLITRATREALDTEGFGNMPVIVGCGAQSTRECIELCKEARFAGGDYALVLPPAYYQGLFSKDTVKDFFEDVANASPIPILIYNYPGAVSGLDLNSDVIIDLAKHPNIVGCKLTCGNTGKLNRIAAATNAATVHNNGSGFMCMGGSVDFTLQTLIGGGSGIIGGMANIAPRTCVKLIELYKDGKFTEAQKLQAIVARGDWAAIRGGIIGTKAGLVAHFGYGGFARRPLPRPSEAEELKWRDDFDELVKTEKSFEKSL